MTDLMTRVKAPLKSYEQGDEALEIMAFEIAQALIAAEKLLDELDVQYTVFGLTPEAAQALAAFRAAMEGRTDG